MNAVIFDMDGLMFDTERICMKAWDYSGETLGFGKCGNMVFKTLGCTTKRAMEILSTELGPTFDGDKFMLLTRSFAENYYKENGVPTMKGLYEILDYLKEYNFKIAVASSSSRHSVMRNLSDANIIDSFDALISGDMITKSKPDPQIYLKACEALGEEPQNCYALEDSRNGIHSAANAGCKTIMVPDLWQPDDETKAIIYAKCDSLLDAIKVIKK